MVAAIIAFIAIWAGIMFPPLFGLYAGLLVIFWIATSPQSFFIILIAGGAIGALLLTGI